MSAAPDRGGSTIIVVIAMLSALMILGFFFFSIAAQENENAETFKENAKELVVVELDPDEIFDCFLEQYILGADPTKYNSVFYGGRHSLLPTMFGTDLSPFNGEGVNATWSGGVPRVDLNYDGTPDPPTAANPTGDAALQINQMPGAQLTAGQNADNDIDLVNNQDRWLPEPDVDYVYPDHNFPLMTYYGFVPSQEHPTGVDLVLMPAGHRPQLLRNRPAVGSGPAQWYSSAATQGYTLRAHRERLAVLSDGNVSNNRRFRADYFSGSGFADPPLEGLWQSNASGDGFIGYDSGTGAFNYDYEANPAGRVDGAGNQVNTAIYLDCDFPVQLNRNTGTQFIPQVAAEILDAEAFLNLNVVGNTNLQYTAPGAALNSISNSAFESKSHLGYSPSEINPSYALLTDPSSENMIGYDFQDYNDSFNFAPAFSSGAPPSGALMANADIWSILHGQPKISSNEVSEVYPGRYGEPERVRIAWEGNRGVGAYPFPGASLEDFNGNGILDPGEDLNDNGYLDLGEFDVDGDGVLDPIEDINKNGVLDPPPDDNFNQNLDYFLAANPVRFSPRPFDRFGLGRQGNAIQRLFATAGNGAVRFPAHNNYFSNNLPWGNHYGVTTMTGAILRAGTAFRDDHSELVVDPSISGNFPHDSPFGAVESMGLQLGDNDLTMTGFQSSLRELLPWSFRETDRAEDIRRSFTTVSHDLKTHSRKLYGSSVADGGSAHVTVPVTRSRNWEWQDNDNDGLVEFPRLINVVAPPAIDQLDVMHSAQPIRHAISELLHAEEGDSQALKLMRKLNVNGITEFDRDFTNLQNKGFLRQRGLVPHSQGIGPTQLTTQFTVPHRVNGYMAFANNVLNSATPIGTSANQEFVARRDRQLLARDIYTLLYLFGHGNDNLDLFDLTSGDNSSHTIYTLEECREMAQFAVNLVDHMDPDDVITKFEYDVNLINGWNLDDYPYAITSASWGDGTTDLPGGERGVVYGVEEQQLAFNEVLAIHADQAEDGMGMPVDNDKTEWNDQANHQFLYMELQNVSGRPVSFSQRNQWQIVCKPLSVAPGGNPSTSAGTANGVERRLNFTNAAPNIGVGANSFLTVSAIANDNNSAATLDFPQGSFPVDAADPVMTGPGPARLRIETSSGTYENRAPFGTAINAMPPASTQHIDLLRNTGQYEIYDTPGTVDDVEDGAKRAPNTAALPSGINFFQLDAPDFDANDYYVELTLRRRANPYRQTPDTMTVDPVESADNPWVVADRIMVRVDSIRGLDGTSLAQSEVENALSSERYQPLFADTTDGLAANDGTQTLKHTLGQLNSISTATYSLWQPHNNHEYASLVDVFNVPLYGPDFLAGDNGPEYQYAMVDPMDGNGPWRGTTMKLGEIIGGGTGDDARLVGKNTFGHRVLNPWGTDGDPGDTDDPSSFDFSDGNFRNNRWHRLLEFIETPEPIHQTVSPDGTKHLNAGAIVFNDVLGKVGGSQTRLYRKPGVINLNTIREPHMLAALMDDPGQLFGSAFGNGVHGFNPLGTNLPTMEDVSPVATTRSQPRPAFPPLPAAFADDWWRIFAISRDGDDPVVSGRVLPGIPGISRPFRGFDTAVQINTANQDDHSIEQTILRSMPFEWETGATAGAQENPRARQLFQLGSDDHNNNFTGPSGPDSNTLDYAYKHRMLAKVLNNTTLRSNTFFVFLQADYFEAEIAPDGAVRVGAKLGNSPGYRGFFIIDRTKAMELIQASDVPDKRNSKSFSFNQNFNWRALLLHRQRLN